MVAPSDTLDNSARDFQRLKTSLHRQIVDVVRKLEDAGEISTHAENEAEQFI